MEGSVLITLLQRSRAGDTAAREELFTKCRNYVNLVARAQVESWMRTKIDASDLVQQTLLEAHRGFDDFCGTTEAEWLAWLRQILSHNTQDFIRRYKSADKRDVNREVALRARGQREEVRSSSIRLVVRPHPVSCSRNRSGRLNSRMPSLGCRPIIRKSSCCVICSGSPSMRSPS